jgi:hypothetical protein
MSHNEEGIWFMVGIAAGVCGFMCSMYAVFLSNSVLGKLLFLTLGLVLLWFAGIHTLYYLSLYATALYASTLEPKAGKTTWNRLSQKCIESMLPVKRHKFKRYNEERNNPVIFMLNSIPLNSTFSESCVPLLNQPHTKMVATKRNGIVGEVLRMTDSLILPEQNAYAHFMKEARDSLLKDKESLIVFPEGKYIRKRNVEKKQSIYELTEFQSGIFELALQDNIPIVPVVLQTDLCKDGLVNRSGVLNIYYLPPVFPNKYESIDALKAIVKKAMENQLLFSQ